MLASKLEPDFYKRPDVVQIAKDLLGKVLVTNVNNEYTAGMIVETEAYLGEEDKASHTYAGRRTKRTETMYSAPGHAYIYLCYGIHNMFNVVTDEINIPKAVLVRALEPIDGINIMMRRRKKERLDFSLTRGPGSVGKAMALHTNLDATPLWSDILWIEDREIKIEQPIVSGTRIGVDYAGADALLPLRFWLKDNPFVSKVPKRKQ